jgi:hypothetical protein
MPNMHNVFAEAAATTTANGQAKGPVMDIREYRRIVEDVMDEARADPSEAPRIFANLGPTHAREVLRTMFDHAKESALIHCHRMDRDVFCEAAVRRFLSHPGATMEVIVESHEAIQSDRSLLPALRDLFGTKLKPWISSHRPRYRHFTVTDHRDLRVEQDQTTRKADVYFSDRKLAKEAEEAFALLRSTSTALSTLSI